MAWLTTADATNEVLVDVRITTFEYLLLWLQPPVTLRNVTTSSTYEYRGIDATVSTDLLEEIAIEDNVVDCYFTRGEGGGGTITKRIVTSTGFLVVEEDE